MTRPASVALAIIAGVVKLILRGMGYFAAICRCSGRSGQFGRFANSRARSRICSAVAS